MNDRIKKLKEQATSYTWNGVDVTEELDESMFAELIIKECAELMYGRDENGNCKDGDIILEHFGVKNDLR